MAGKSQNNLKKFIVLDVHYPPHSVKLTGDKRRNKTENQVWLNIDHENKFSIIEALFHYFLPIKRKLGMFFGLVICQSTISNH